MSFLWIVTHCVNCVCLILRSDQEESNELDVKLSEDNPTTAFYDNSQLTRAQWVVHVYACIEVIYCNADHFFRRFLFKNGSVSHDPKLGTFTVLGSMRKPHAVRIFLTESCSCPSSTQCYHIIAVKMSLEMPVENHKKVNLSQLRWNTRSKNQRKTGRKRPRAGMRKLIFLFLVF